MGSCTIKFDGNEFNYEEFATKLHDGLLQELVDSKAVDINKFKGEIPGYIKIKPLSVFEQQEPIKEKPVEKKPTESKQEVKGELSDIELKYKNDPDSLTRDELKDVLEIKRKRLRKAIDSWSNRNLTKLEIEIKKKGIAILEKTEEDLIKRIDAGVNQKIASRNQATEMASQGSFSNPISPNFSLTLDENLAEETIDEVASIIDNALNDPNFATSETITIDDVDGKDVGSEKINVDIKDGRPESLLMSKLRIGIDFIFGKSVGLGMSDTLTTGSKSLPVMNTQTGKIENQEVRNEGGIGYPFKSLLDLLNGVETNVNKIMAWAGVSKGAAGGMMNAARKANKILGSDLKAMYFKALGLDVISLTKEQQAQKDRLEKAIPNKKQYGLVIIYKMGNDGILSNEAFAREAFRQIETTLSDSEKKKFLALVKERATSKIKWAGKEEYQSLIANAKSFLELENILHGENSKLSLDIKASIVKVLILSTKETVSTKTANPVGEFLKSKGISIESVTQSIEEPVMDSVTKGQPMILLAVDFDGSVFEDKSRERHKNYPFGVPGFPIGVFNETMMLHNLSPEMMDTFVKTSTAIVQNAIEKKSGNPVVFKIKENEKGTEFSVYRVINGKETFLFTENEKSNINIKLSELGFQLRMSFFQKNDGLFYAEEGTGESKLPVVDKNGTPISSNTIDGLYTKLNKLGKKVSKETIKYPYNQKINGNNFGNLLQKAKSGFINIFSDVNLSAQQKLVKLLQRSFPGITVELTQGEYIKLNNEFIGKKLINKNGKSYGFVKDGRVYLNPTYLNNNTPIHEFGHIWNAVAKQYRKDIYDKGVALVKDSKYFDFVLSSGEYKKIINGIFGDKSIIKDKLTGKDIINPNANNYAEILDYVSDEALAKAIGDKGELFVNDSQKKAWLGFLTLLFNAIKQVIGFNQMTSEQFQNLTLDGFVNAALKELLSGKEISNITSEQLSVLNKDKSLGRFSVEVLQSEKESLKADLKEMEKARKEKAQILGFSAIESEEQIRERVKNDKEYFGKLVRYAIVSIELGLVKSMNQLREAFKKDLGMDFTKALNKELGLIYNTAKESATTTKKKTIKQTIKSATEVKTDKSIKISFAEFMDTIYKSENKGYKTKKELIKFALAYLKSQNISVLAMPKILQLIDRAIELKSLDKFDKSFADYVDYYVSQASRLAKVAESEEVANKLKKKISAEKLGQITPQAIRLANLQLDLLTDSELDLFISLAKDLLTQKIAEVKNLKIGLEELIMAERAAIENGIENNLFSDKELISLIDKLHVLNEESQTPGLEEAEQIAKSKDFAAQQGEVVTLLRVKRSIIMSYIDSYSDKITDIKSYVKLSNSIKQYNNLLAALNSMGGISDVELDELSIRMSNKNLTLLEQSLKDRLDEFKSELVRDIKQLSRAARSEFTQGTMRDKLFSFMSAFDKALYTPVLLGILDEKATNILEKMDIADLDLYQRGLEQLLNGYISPSLREINEVINATYVREDMDAHIDNYVENESKFTSAWNRFSEKWIKSIKDLYTEEDVIEFLKTKNWQSIKDRLAESGLASIYEKYVHPVIATSFTPYLKARKDITERVTIASDKVKDIHKVVLGIFATQLDLMRHEKWKGEVLVDTILQKYEDKELNGVSKKRIANLKEAKALIKGDISTRDGLLKAMDTFFSENKNAKVLYNEIRSAIDNKVFEMTKINIEREGGYVEFDSEYFPIQRVGFGEYKSQSFADLFESATKSKRISTRSNATFKRIADPLVMREFDIVKAFDNMVDDVAKNYYLRPVIVPLERSITSLANKYGDKKSDFYDKDIAVFLRGIRGFVHTNLSLELSRQEYSSIANIISQGTRFTRSLYLANLLARAKDLVSNIFLVLTSRNPLVALKYFGKQEVELSKDDFAALAELTNSPIIFNKSIKDIEDQYSVSVTASKKKLDSIASMADVPVKRKYWKALFLLEFKKATGKNFDSKLFKADYVSYYLENKEVIDKIARLADYEVDKKFSAQLPFSQAMVFSVLPAIPFLKIKGESFKGFQFQKKSTTATLVKYMTTYVAWGSDVVLNATYRLLRSRDVKGFARDVTPIVASATMFTVSGFYAKALGSTLAYGSKALFASLLSSLVGEDDDDKDKDKQSVMDYAKEQLAWANSHIYTADGVNWDEVEAAYIDLLVTLGTSKYATGIKDGLGFVLGIIGAGDVKLSSDKATEKETAEKWVNINNYYRAGFKSGIPFTSTNSKLPTKPGDFYALVPFVGSYSNILGNVLNEKDESSAVTFYKGIVDNDLERVALGVSQLGTLVLTGVGLSWAPTGYALVTAEAKLQATKDMEKFRKESKAGKGKSSKPSNPFGSPGLGGGLGGPKGF